MIWYSPELNEFLIIKPISFTWIEHEIRLKNGSEVNNLSFTREEYENSLWIYIGEL
jgi:hypothetical protein